MGIPFFVLEQEQSQAQVEHDVERRTLNGVYIYVLGWLAIGIGTGFYQTEGDCN